MVGGRSCQNSLVRLAEVELTQALHNKLGRWHAAGLAMVKVGPPAAQSPPLYAPGLWVNVHTLYMNGRRSKEIVGHCLVQGIYGHQAGRFFQVKLTKGCFQVRECLRPGSTVAGVEQLYAFVGLGSFQ